MSSGQHILYIRIEINKGRVQGNKLGQKIEGMGHGGGWRGLLEEEEQSEEFVKEFSVIIKKPSSNTTIARLKKCDSLGQQSLGPINFSPTKSWAELHF